MLSGNFSYEDRSLLVLGRGRKVAYSTQLYIRSGPAHAPPAVHERRRSFILESRSLSNEDMHVDEEVGVLREEPLVDEAGTEFGLGMVGLGAARADEAGVDICLCLFVRRRSL